MPLGLSPFYPLTRPIAPFSVPYILSGLVVAVATVLSILLRRRCPGLLAVWIVYVATILPVSGILHNGGQISADRYSYLPALSLAILAGAGVLGLARAGTSRRQTRTLALWASGASILVVALLTVLTWRQVGIWHDPERLWSYALAITPSSTAHEHLGYLRRLQGRLPEAIEHYQSAAALGPGAFSIRIQWGNALAQQGMLAAAIDRYREALHLAPGSAAPHYHWANALFAAGRLDEAITQYRETIRLDPSVAEAYNNWGRALAQQGKWEEAITRYREALRIRPNYPLAAANLDQALSEMSKAPARGAGSIVSGGAGRAA